MSNLIKSIWEQPNLKYQLGPRGFALTITSASLVQVLSLIAAWITSNPGIFGSQYTAIVSAVAALATALIAFFSGSQQVVEDNTTKFAPDGKPQYIVKDVP